MNVTSNSTHITHLLLPYCRPSKLILLALLFTSLCCAPVYADNIYTWTDQSGVAHYSTGKDDPKARIAELPAVNRGEVRLSYGYNTESVGLTCDKHGGINCQAGPDEDGSVICVDGYRKAVSRFLFSCNSPKLSIDHVSKPDAKAIVRVFVRNSSSVIAENPYVWFKLNSGEQQRLQGPKQIGPYELAKFELQLDSELAFRQLPRVSQMILSCANC